MDFPSKAGESKHLQTRVREARPTAARGIGVAGLWAATTQRLLVEGANSGQAFALLGGTTLGQRTGQPSHSAGTGRSRDSLAGG